MRLQVLQILILSPNFSKIYVFSPKFCIVRHNFQMRGSFRRVFPIWLYLFLCILDWAALVNNACVCLSVVRSRTRGPVFLHVAARLVLPSTIQSDHSLFAVSHSVEAHQPFLIVFTTLRSAAISVPLEVENCTRW